MNLQSYLQTSSEEIQKEVDTLLLSWHTYTKSIDPIFAKLSTIYSQSIRGGKTIRGTLVKIGYLLAKGKETKKILPIAAAFEILHTSLLIHDDIIDKSDTRRNKSSLWKEVGINQAICLGDIGFFLSQKIIAQSDFPVINKQRALLFFSDCILDTLLGEMLDVAQASEIIQKKEKDILKIHALKTASYSTIAPLILGALLGGASKKVLDAIKSFGTYTGIAFQIQDDVLGVFGSEKKLGKSAKSDIEENKNTLLISYALQHGNSQQKKILKTYYGKKEITLKNYQEIKQVLEDTGSREYSYKKAKEYVTKAKEFIPQITKNKNTQTLLSQFADFIIERNK